MPFFDQTSGPSPSFVFRGGHIYPPFCALAGCVEKESQTEGKDTMKFLNSAWLYLLVGVACALTQNDNGIPAQKNSLRSAAAAKQKTASTTAKNEADMFTDLLQPHSIQTFQLRPTSTLLFEGDSAMESSANSNNGGEKLNDEQRRKLFQHMVGVYGTLRHLSAEDMVDGVGDMAIDDSTRRLVAKHNQLLEQFNAERHLSRFERYERNMAVQGRRQLDDQNKEVDVDDAATAIAEAAIETYEGVLPVITESANVTESNEDLTGDASLSASLCSANDQCVAQGLTGQCCPTNSGTYLACCSKNDEAGAATSSSALDIIPPPPGSDVEAPVVSLSSPHEPEPPIIIDNAPVDPAMAEASAIIEDLFDGENPDMVDIIEEEHEEEEAFKEMAEAAGIIPVEEEEQLTGGRLNSYQTTPLGQGYGTHYAHVWVGSPKPQRQSVIVDTGSHHTAFPCKECSNCGESYHTDNYFDWSQSTTFHPLTCSECEPGASCSGDKCQFSQSYTEGSSWHAYQVKDQFFCGGNEPDAWNNPIDRSYAIDFTFGCQTSETVSFALDE